MHIFSKCVLITSTLCLSFFNAAAQEEEPAAYVVNNEFNLYQASKGNKALVFVNNAYIRSEPTSKSSLIDSIPLGTTVEFVDDDGLNPTSLRGMYLPWHKIQYQSENKSKTGYIWLGLLSLNQTVDSLSGNTFIYGFDWKSQENDNPYYWVEAKVLDKHKSLIGQQSFAYYPGDQSYCSAELTAGMGIPNALNTYSIRFNAEACGIATETYNLSWNGTKFTTLPKTTSVSDAGVFYYDENLIYPNNHRLGNQIILKQCEEGEAENYEETDTEIQYTIKKREETYQFDGNTYQKIAEKIIK